MGLIDRLAEWTRPRDPDESMDGFATNEQTRSRCGGAAGAGPMGSLWCVPRGLISAIVCWGIAWGGAGAEAVAQGYYPLPLHLPMSETFATGSEPLIYNPYPPPSGLQFLPPETIYPAYLAGPHESRLGTQAFSEDDDGSLWDSTLGGRVGLFRGLSFDGARRWQLDVEGAAILRLDPEEDVDLRSVDFRAGVPLTMASGPHRWKLGYYHLSAHIGDEFLLKNPDFERLNYVRDALVLGYSRYASERLRLYAEASWAFYREISDPWHFQFGMEYAPTRPTGILGEPFFAINGLLREEVDYGGTVTVHTGWAWREARVGRLLRTGFFFQAGKSHQFEFFDESERQIGVGLWYDF